MRAPAVPDCRTPAEIVAYLHELRSWAGAPSFIELTKRVNKIRQRRKVRDTASSTVNDCFRRDRKRLDRELVLDIAEALGLDKPGLVRLEQCCQIADGRRSIGDLADVTDAIPSGREEFVGRELSLEKALAAIDVARREQRPPVVVFTGPAGIGKTELAVQLAHELVRRVSRPPKQFFVDLHGFDTNTEPSPPDEVLSALLKLTGVRGSAVLALSTREQRQSRLGAELNGKPTVLIYDSVADVAQLNGLLPRVRDTTVVATTRKRLDLGESAKVIEVEELEFHHCVALLAGFDVAGRVRRETGAMLRLINEQCGRRPFDVITLGGQLADPDEADWSLADHEERLKRVHPEEFSHRILAGSCHRLDPQVRRVFRLLSLYPGFDFSVYDAASLADVDVDRAAKFLRQLYDRHLLLDRGSHRYRLHHTVADYALWLLHREESWTNQRAALRRLRSASTINAQEWERQWE